MNADLLFVFERLPLILGPLLVLAAYYLTRELTLNNDTASLLGSFLTAVSLPTLIGIYAGSYANWFALIIGYLCIIFLFRYLKVPSRFNLSLYSVLVVSMLL